MIMAATHNKLDLASVEDALKAQWGDEDLDAHDTKFKTSKGLSKAYAAVFGGGGDAESWFDAEEEE